tara:strand:+ start:112 stop:825 length:714 start_codon:yes stop_codon:yes gene_type:complete
MKFLKKFLEYILDSYVVSIHNKKILKKIDTEKLETVIDIGAHKLELLNSLRKYNFEFKNYVAFEPEQYLFNELKKKYGNDKTIELHNVALGKYNEVKNLSVNMFSTTNTFAEINQDLIKYKIKYFLSKLFRKSNLSKTQDIGVMKLDDYINKLNNPVSIIKIDTEGFEKEVIEGSKKFIAKKNPKYLIVELQKENNYQNYSPKLIEKLIDELGYVKIFEKKGPLNLFKDCVYKIVKI